MWCEFRVVKNCLVDGISAYFKFSTKKYYDLVEQEFNLFLTAVS